MGNQPIKRVIVIVLDGVGVGEAPDAANYGDVGSNSVGNTAAKLGGLKLPTLEQYGFGNIIAIQGVPRKPDALAAWGKLQPKSMGKDSITGHWELMGVYLKQPFPTFPNGFPDEVLQLLAKAGLEFIGNKVASGTDIIQEYGEEHARTGKPILYTSADSVFQVAAHEAVIPLERLYEICQTARNLLVDEYAVARVIARPFIGDKASGYTRTSGRHDYALEPLTETVMDSLTKANFAVHSVGKIYDLFNGRGITKQIHGKSNQDCLKALSQDLDESFEGLVFVNLVEFDMIYGHRNDYQGYANALREFDDFLPTIIAKLRPDDLMMISADHGVDPTTPSTDHSREYVPLLIFGQPIQHPVDLGTRDTLADVGATIAEIFELPQPPIGQSFLESIS